jgi:hypothetical protein
MAGNLEVDGNRISRAWMQRHIADLTALAPHLQVLDAAALLDVGHAQRAQLGAAQAVK